MKKFTFLLIAAVISLSSVASVNSNQPARMIDTRNNKVKIEKSQSPDRRACAQGKTLNADGDKVITEIPEGCQIHTYYRNSGCIIYSYFGIYNTKTDGKITIAFDMSNGDVYIQNPSWHHEYYDTWVKGSYDWMTGIISIPTGQYLVWYDDDQYGIQLVWGSTYPHETGVDDEGNPVYNMNYTIDESTTDIEFVIEDDCIYLLGSKGDINAEFPDWGDATGMMTIYSDTQTMTSLEMARRNEYGHTEPFGYIVSQSPAVPANPSAIKWYDCGDESGYSRFQFALPQTDVDGYIIDPECISYAVWINDGMGSIYQYTFPAQDYKYDLVVDINEVPYELYSNGTDFRDSFVYMYRTNENDNPLFVRDNTHKGNIGIQAFYTVDDVKNASDIVWLYEAQTGVDELAAGKTVASVRYYNVAGQQVAQPSGLTIQVTTYTDGTTSAVKVVK